MNTVTIQPWNIQEFKEKKIEWTDLLNSSDADKLFLSWEWQYSWWDTFAPLHNLDLTLLAAYDKHNILIGIAPLYTIKSKTKKFINTKQLQFIGNICRGKSTMLTEFIDFIVARENSSNIKHAFLEYINKKLEWDEFHLPELKKESSTYSFLIKANTLPNSHIRIVDEYKSYYVDTTSQFSNYISQRGKNTRLRMFNRRKVLNAKGDLTIRRAAESEIDEHFELLNDLHQKRWGKKIFTGERLIFNTNVAKEMAKRGCLNFSVLLMNNEPISIQFNYIVNHHEYNIQAGFEEEFDKKIALGYLHFGYEVETAFENETLIYDFLAGEGKNTNYKERLTDTFHDMIQLQIIRKRSLKYLYLINDFLGHLKQKLTA